MAIHDVYPTIRLYSLDLKMLQAQQTEDCVIKPKLDPKQAVSINKLQVSVCLMYFWLNYVCSSFSVNRGKKKFTSLRIAMLHNNIARVKVKVQHDKTNKTNNLLIFLIRVGESTIRASGAELGWRGGFQMIRHVFTK